MLNTQSHLVKNNLRPMLQLAYRKLHSTETTLVKVHNDILTNMNKQHVTFRRSAFETVYPSILLTRLISKLSLNGTACSFVVLLLSVWLITTNICSGSAFKYISSLSWHSPGFIRRLPFVQHIFKQNI